MVGTEARADTEPNRCLDDQTRRKDDTVLKAQDATVIRVAGVDGCPAGCIDVSVSSRPDREPSTEEPRGAASWRSTIHDLLIKKARVRSVDTERTQPGSR